MKKYEKIGEGVLLRLYGDLDIWKCDLQGRVVEERHLKNTIVDAGEIWVAELLAGEQYDNTVLTYSGGELGYGLQYVQVGEDTSATTQGMYALQDQTAITTAYTAVDNDVDSPGNKIVSRGTYSTAIGNGTLTEAGLFSNTGAPSSSTDTTSRMFNRSTFPSISKDTSFSLTLQWTITIGTVA